MHTMAKRLFSGLVGLLFCVIAAVPVLAENQGAAWATVQGQQALVYLRGLLQTPSLPARLAMSR